MAIWQWDVFLIPRKKTKKYFLKVPHCIDLEWFESINWWDTFPKDKLIDFFSSLLPIYFTPWAKNTHSWGCDDGDRIELTIENGKISGVVIRIDIRNLNSEFLKALAKFSEDNNLLFVSLESGKFINTIFPDLLNEIENSRKSNFLSNPDNILELKKYFDKINAENRRKLE